MRFHPTAIAGVIEIVTEPHNDERGSFVRTFCAREFAAYGLNPQLAQCNFSTNTREGTLRGFHIQAEPHGEDKLVHCTAGRIFDVALDLRPDSPTFGQHHSVNLSATEGRMLYIPQGCAHAFQAMEDASALTYYLSTFYEPASMRGVRWNDPEIGVRWPFENPIMNQRDRELPLLRDYISATSC
jgi:dTDP-4-dehydrorhamnose 3,5-epimerase